MCSQGKPILQTGCMYVHQKYHYRQLEKTSENYIEAVKIQSKNEAIA